MRVAFDSRPGAGGHRAAHYSRRLLDALRETAREGDEIVETHRPRTAEVFHSPWFEGAMLHSPCPMVVTIHDVSALTRRSERLRSGGVYAHLRHLALQRATHVIVTTDALLEEAVAGLGLERERLIVIPPGAEAAAAAYDIRPAPTAVSTPPPAAALLASPPASDWTWRSVARATWRVYADALARPERPCVRGLSMRPAARARRARSSAGS